MEHAKERFQAFLLEAGAKPSSSLLSKEKLSLIRRYLLEGTIYKSMQEKIAQLLWLYNNLHFYSANVLQQTFQ